MSPLLTFGAPPDRAAWTALVAAALVVALWRPCKPWVLAHPKLCAGALAVLATALSHAYVTWYLRGGPRIIDATSYFLEAKALAHGAFNFEPLTPSGSFRGRFLTGPSGDTSLSVIFPPGYPLVLALGFIARQPMWIGPLCAGGLVVCTYQLALRLFQSREIALAAAAFSVACATLRYHTADTMSHGWAALLFTFSLLALTHRSSSWTLFGGIAAGWLIATRPVTGMLCVATGLFRLRIDRQSLVFLVGLLPGLGLLALHQHAATGEWLASSQVHYYSLADGPPGCFRYGFGKSVGCVFEHGDVVKNTLANGFGPSEALLTSIHRLHWHMLDLANLEAFALVLPYAFVVGRHVEAVRWLGFAIVGIVVAYAPFYFNGSYPGGGARFFADVLPLEHVLLAWGLARLGGLRVALPLALLGFALHGAYSHRALANRDGGRPMYSAAALERAGITHGLVLVATDHGFNLGFDPQTRDASRGVVVARERNDAHDRVLWENLGRPAVYRYQFRPGADSSDRVIAGRPPKTPPWLQFEAEYEWPPLRVNGGYAYPSHVGASCASAGRVLTLVPEHEQTLTVEMELAVLRAGRYDLEARWVSTAQSSMDFSLRIADGSYQRSVAFRHGPCSAATIRGLSLARGSHSILLSVKVATARLDSVRLIPR